MVVQDQVWMTTTTLVANAKDRATAPIVEAKARTTDMSRDPQEQVICLMQKHREQINLAYDVELLLMKALWDLRGTVKVDDMIRWTGWSKQTLYNKWAKYGLKE
jgi:hypothetical protein